MRNLKPSFARLLVLICVPFLGGCLRFATQTIEFAYEAAQDRAALHLVYHGICWGKDGQEKGQKALQRAVDGGEFCLVDWPLHFSPAEMRGEKHPIAQFLGAHLKSHMIGFFKDADGQLSGGQVVVLDKVSELLKLANAEISKWLIEGDGKPKDMHWDRHTQSMLLDAAKQGHQWIRVNGNAIALHAFCSDHDYTGVKAAGLLQLMNSKPKDFPEAIAWLSRLPVGWQRTANRIVISLGNPDGRTRIDVPREGRKPYVPNLEAHASKTWGLELDAKVAPKLLAPDETVDGQFARSLSLRERVRILMTQEGAVATKRLQEAVDELPREPRLDEGGIRGFWQGWLEHVKSGPDEPEVPLPPDDDE